MSKKVIIRKKPVHPTVKVGVPVNVKVEGTRTVLKRVTLAPIDGRTDAVKVMTGRRGRPSILQVASIERVRVL